MTSIPCTINLRPVNIQKFDSVEEAIANLPTALVLQWINTCYRNMQCAKYVDAFREASRNK